MKYRRAVVELSAENARLLRENDQLYAMNRVTSGLLNDSEKQIRELTEELREATGRP